MSSLEAEPGDEFAVVAPDGFEGLAQLWEADVNIRHRARQSVNWGGPQKVGIVSMTLDLRRLVHIFFFGMSHCTFDTLKIFGTCIWYPLGSEFRGFELESNTKRIFIAEGYSWNQRRRPSICGWEMGSDLWLWGFRIQATNSTPEVDSSTGSLLKTFWNIFYVSFLLFVSVCLIGTLG